jgi:hypothetical protein
LITAGNGTQSSTWTFANSGVLTFPDGTTQSTAATGGGSNYGNVNVKAYTESMGFQNYGNANVASYLPTHTGNVGVNYLLGTTPNVTVTAGTFNSVFDTTGNVILPNVYVSGNVTAQYLFGNGAFLTGIVTSGGSGTNYSNVNVKAYTETMGFANYGNVNVAAYLNTQGYNLYSNVNVASYLSTATINTTGNITAAYLTGNINITGNVTGTSPNVTIQAGSFSSVFDNQGNVTVPRLFTAGNIQTAGYLFGNGAFLTGIVTSGGSSYSNVQVATYLPTYSGNIAANFANVSSLQVNGSTTLGNVSITSRMPTYEAVIAYTNTSHNMLIEGGNRLQLSSLGNIDIQPGNGQTVVFSAGMIAGKVQFDVPVISTLTTAATSTTTGAVTVAGGVGIAGNAFVSGIYTNNYFYANGSPISFGGGGSNYSNVNVATYLPTYSGNVANIRLGVSGVLTFADGTTQTTASAGGGSSYSNVNVAAYLTTYGGAIQSSNVQTTTANIQATTAATNPATGALRVMGGVGVAGAVVAGQLNSTGNLIANAVSAYSLNTVANVTASVVNAGTINSSGNVLAQNIIGTIATASQPSITAVGTLATLSVTGNATVGNLIGTEANTRIIANTYVTTFDIYGNVTFPGNIITPTGLYVGPTLFTALPNTVAQFTSNANSYVQINFENLSSGTDATSDYIATANNGTDTTFFVDLGIANSNYDNLSPNNSLGTAVFANDSYLYAQGNLATTTGGNLVIGTSTANKSVKIFAGGINSANIVATVSNTGVAVTGNVTATGNITATGYIVTTGGFGNITQVDYITANNVVATANVTVQGMGVTMPNRPAFRVNGTSLYGGAQSTANVNLKGVAVSTAYNQGSYFDATTCKWFCWSDTDDQQR